MPVRRFFVEGRVQGVFFRASTAEQARRLGITGHAVNLADGRVEVLAWGDPAALATLARWLTEGPPGARVDAVTEDAAPVAGARPEGFRTG